MDMDLHIKTFNKSQMNEILKLLAWMELCGNIGHCSDFTVRFDGDGQANLKVSFDNEAIQNSYDEMRRKLLRQYDENGKETKFIIE
jgi:hypothetical protein